ncbi:hypothetical protein B0H17DRAFT_1136607 [Mycena rosella]|uniref:Uncharacterized protein n=1 Tax=Mycena rosella TaxID=1033263 RepID=A0AAD7DAD5_MYCRO|nr:hypothetical protein B0H17DRAFT_1136607 [Mycena rosella]
MTRGLNLILPDRPVRPYQANSDFPTISSPMDSNPVPLLPTVAVNGKEPSSAEQRLEQLHIQGLADLVWDEAEPAVGLRCLALNMGHTVLMWATMNLCGHALLANAFPDQFAANFPAAIRVGVVGAQIAFPVDFLAVTIQLVTTACCCEAHLLDDGNPSLAVRTGTLRGTLYFCLSSAPPGNFEVPFLAGLMFWASIKGGAAGGAALFIGCQALRRMGLAEAYEKAQADPDFNCEELTKHTRWLGPALIGVTTSLVRLGLIKLYGYATLDFGRAAGVGAVGGALMGYFGVIMRVS